MKSRVGRRSGGGAIYMCHLRCFQKSLTVVFFIDNMLNHVMACCLCREDLKLFFVKRSWRISLRDGLSLKTGKLPFNTPSLSLSY